MSGKKAKGMIVKLVSMAGTGYFYTTKKNLKANKPKLLLRKYDPVLRQHTLFKVRTASYHLSGLKTHHQTLTNFESIFRSTGREDLSYS